MILFIHFYFWKEHYFFCCNIWRLLTILYWTKFEAAVPCVSCARIFCIRFGYVLVVAPVMTFSYFGIQNQIAFFKNLLLIALSNNWSVARFIRSELFRLFFYTQHWRLSVVLHQTGHVLVLLQESEATAWSCLLNSVKRWRITSISAFAIFLAAKSVVRRALRWSKLVWIHLLYQTHVDSFHCEISVIFVFSFKSSLTSIRNNPASQTNLGFTCSHKRWLTRRPSYDICRHVVPVQVVTLSKCLFFIVQTSIEREFLRLIFCSFVKINFQIHAFTVEVESLLIQIEILHGFLALDEKIYFLLCGSFYA